LRDAVSFLDPEYPEEGFVFDGRVVEDFKLSTGTWVNVGILRTNFLGHCSPYAQDALIAGHDRDDVGVLIFPNVEACRAKAELPAEALAAEVMAHPAVRALFQELMNGFALKNSGGSNRIVRAMLMTDRPSFEAGEITDKGSLNQLATLQKRANMVEQLYAPEPADHVITIDKNPSL
jgi:feruloyl-CoA synthase